MGHARLAGTLGAIDTGSAEISGAAKVCNLRRAAFIFAGHPCSRDARTCDMNIRNLTHWLLSPPTTGPRAIILIRLMVGGVFVWEGLG